MKQPVYHANIMKNAIPNNINLPVLKSWNRIFDLLGAIYNHGFDRDGFQQAILDLYGNEKSSKSVFRGMAIPTLRNLGFIIGYGSVIRISANGSLIYNAYQKSYSEGIRVLKAVLMEIESINNFGILDYLLNKSTVNYEDLINVFLKNIEISEIRRSPNPLAKEKAARERLTNWINFLVFAEILYKDRENIRIDTENYIKSLKDLDPGKDKKENFDQHLIKAYKKIVFSQNGLGTVEIENLRESVSFILYNKYDEVLTERQFDILLTEFPKSTSEYVVTLGRSMGADEKLFKYQGKYYQTLFVRFLNSA